MPLRRNRTRKHITRRSKSSKNSKHVLRRSKHVLRRNRTYKKRTKGGNYTTDITSDTFEGFSYVNPNTTVVAYPGGVRSLASYKNKANMDDMDGFNPLA
jgi:hypothetical protein